MATLADLFNEKSQDIYKKFSPRTGNAQSQPYVSVMPDSNASRSRIKDDNRAVPVVSTLRDKERISKFLKSSDGILFIAKQALLQTGNTFVSTKIYNPVSPLLNVIPFVHVRRFIPTQTITNNPSGLLQNSTVEEISNRIDISGKIQALPSLTRKTLLPTVTSLAKSYIGAQVRGAAKSILPLPQNYFESRAEYRRFGYVNNGRLPDSSTGPVIFDPQPLNQRGIQRLNYTATIKSQLISKAVTLTVNALSRVIPKSIRKELVLPTVTPDEKIPSFIQAAKEFREKQRKNNENRFKSKYLIDGGALNTEDSIATPLSSGISGINPVFGSVLRDPYNYEKYFVTNDNNPTDVTGNKINNSLNYNNIIGEQENGSDIIKFIFRDIDNSNPVHFRALLSSIKESIKTEFTDQRYVGRTERFVTYGGAKRGLNLIFNVVAFSKDEVDAMWTRVNYLSGLAFPKGVQNGFMVPPLFKMTIGGLYENQPCYIESLDYDFLDESITFDIDREVPFAINVTMQLSILEKRSKFFDSPFYKITEDAEKTIRDRENNNNIINQNTLNNIRQLSGI